MTNNKINLEGSKYLGFEYNYPLSKYSPDDAGKGLLLFIIIQTIITLIYQITAITFGEFQWMSYFFTTILDGGFVYCAYKMSGLNKGRFVSDVKLDKKPHVLHIFLAIALSLVCIFGFSGVTNVFLQLLYNMGYVSTSSDIIINNFGVYIVYVIFVCILPAVCEEIMFRGLIFNSLKKISTTTAVLGSAFLFMLMHGSPDQTVHQFILGIILALTLLYTGSIWVPIMVHFFNNFIAVTYSYIIYGDSASTGSEAVEIYLSQYIIYAVVTAFVACCLAYLIFRTFVRLRKNSEESKAKEEFEKQDNVVYVDGEYAKESVQTQDSYDAQPIFRETVEMKKPSNKMTRQGKTLLIISVIWMTVDWIYALIAGFATNIY